MPQTLTRSPRLLARAAGTTFLVSIVIGVFAEFRAHGNLRLVGRLAAVSGYVIVAMLLYHLLKPVSKPLSTLAAFFSLAVLVAAPLRWHPAGVDVGLVCFGFSALIVAYLVYKSTFLPQLLALPSALAGLAWLTFLSRALGRSLYPYNLVIGVLGQALLCLWLMVMAVDTTRWAQQANERK